jgi:lipopolysaccharide transport system permease protein
VARYQGALTSKRRSGAAWAIIQPVLTMVVFSLFFGKLGKITSDGIPYPIFCFVGLVPWTFFATGLMHTSNSLVGSSNLIKRSISRG